MKLTDFFSYEELLSCEPADNFVYLGAEYSELVERSKIIPLNKEEEIKAIRALVRMLSSVFGFPVLLACDCYIKMLDIYDVYEADKIEIMSDLAKVLTEHITENNTPSPKMITLSNPLESFKRKLEDNWKKDLN